MAPDGGKVRPELFSERPPAAFVRLARMSPAPPAVLDPPVASPRRRGGQAAEAWTPAELRDRFGAIPPGRVVTVPAPGTATVADWEAANRRGDGLYELIDATLVRKAVSDLSSWLGTKLARLLGNFAEDRGLGYVHGADGFFDLPDGLRAPDASFTRLADRPHGLRERGYSDVPPALVAEALSPGNTRREMALKRRIYFSVGVDLVWEADPLARTVTVWTAPDESAALIAGAGDVLTGGSVLPGFSVPLADLFTPPGPPAG